MYREFENSAAGANNCAPMESRDHFKNGVSPKNHRSRGKFLMFARKTCLMLIMLLTFSMSAFAEVTWNFDAATGTLTISEGEIPDYYGEVAPWYPYKESITTIVIENGVISIGIIAFENYLKLKEVKLIDGPTITIKNAAFNNTRINTVHLGRNIKDGGYFIDPAPFSEIATLKTLTIGNNVDAINSNSFKNTGLTSVEIPNSVERIGDYAFHGCADLANVTIIGNKLEKIGSYAFSNSGLTSIKIPNLVSEIGVCAFENCTKLKEINLIDGTSTITIGNVAFNNTAINTIHLGRKIKDGGYFIDPAPFSEIATLKTLTIGNNVDAINSNSFKNTGLTSVEIPNSVERIGDYAFRGCTDLTSITIGSSVKTIGNYAFFDCTGLKQITSLPCPPPTIQSTTFNGVNKSIPVYVNCECIDTYRTTNYWKEFTNWRDIETHIECPPDVSISEVAQESNLTIYPNPTNGQLRIINSELPITKVEVYSLTGALLLSEENFKEEISVSVLPQGGYMVRIYTDGGSVVRKFVKE